MNKNIRFKDKDDNTLLPLPCNILKTTYDKLKAQRDAGTLVKGMHYRITDYQCTTTQANTQAANHQFDIIVTATSESTLSESARAMPHDGDTYFAKCNLQAWNLMYCLDNDVERFAWADTENGKGVVYRMIDEWSNDLPYDFKNIMFKRSYCKVKDFAEYIGIPGVKVYYDGKDAALLPEQDDTKTTFCYTFSYFAIHDDDTDLTQADVSVGLTVFDNKKEKDVDQYPYGNTFAPYVVGGIRSLPNITFQVFNSFATNIKVYGNDIGPDCHDITFNAHENYCNSFNGIVQACIFYKKVTDNTIGGTVEMTSFLSDVNSNRIDGDVRKNRFEGTVSHNVISGRVEFCQFKKGVYWSAFISQTLSCTFECEVLSSQFAGICNGCNFTGTDGTALQYVRQAGEIYNRSAKTPAIATGVKYIQLLTVDLEGNMVVKTF